MTQLDPGVQVQLITATLNLLGGPRVHLRNEAVARKYIQSFRFLYCGLAAGVAKGEIAAAGDAEECFHKLPLARETK